MFTGVLPDDRLWRHPPRVARGQGLFHVLRLPLSGRAAHGARELRALGGTVPPARRHCSAGCRGAHSVFDSRSLASSLLACFVHSAIHSRERGGMPPQGAGARRALSPACWSLPCAACALVVSRCNTPHGSVCLQHLSDARCAQCKATRRFLHTRCARARACTDMRFSAFWRVQGHAAVFYKMQPRALRVAKGLVVMAALVTFSAIMLHVTEGAALLDGCYWAFTTLATVGAQLDMLCAALRLCCLHCSRARRLLLAVQSAWKRRVYVRAAVQLRCSPCTCHAAASLKIRPGLSPDPATLYEQERHAARPRRLRVLGPSALYNCCYQQRKQRQVHMHVQASATSCRAATRHSTAATSSSASSSFRT
jgi:hypothetical protein